MKKLVCVLFCLSLTFIFGCSKTDSTESSKVTWVAWETDETSESTVPFTVPLTPEESQSSYEASVSEEQSLNEQFARYDEGYSNKSPPSSFMRSIPTFFFVI